MMQQFGRLALMDEEQTQELKEHSDFTRIEVIKSLGEWPSCMKVYVLSEKNQTVKNDILYCTNYTCMS